MGHRSSPRERPQRSLLCKGGSSKSFQEMTSMFQPLEPRLSSSFFSWVRFILGKSRFQTLPQLSSTPPWIPQNHRSLFRHPYGPETQASALWSQRCSKIMASSLLSDHGQQRDDSDEVRLVFSIVNALDKKGLICPPTPQLIKSSNEKHGVTSQLHWDFPISDIIWINYCSISVL